ncbi:MAG: phage holin family protein [Pseudomonadota bacterium]
MATTEQASPGSKGLIGSLRGLAGTFLALVRTRADLIAIELQEERERIKEVFILLIVASILCTLGLLLLAFLIIALFWDSYRLLAISIVTLVFLGGAIWSLVSLLEKLNANPPMFSATLNELQHDLDGLKTDEK